ncbi:ABC transporter permease subunit [Sulfuracidifex tepidarius]|uniref:ABC-2 type transporter domain-containing protein n=1 Tax=Sulfuracidifex tepidarius TaxID=1294262 RepID=A0A510E228_9CREN|nr:ABC transporter permease subunit [Sulfuracidifex tepidarius]BBG26180.1 hypothetical protein IC007_0685 [Sulfuracidifex tepidarius]
MRPFVFDFKRSFLRISTLLFLVVFAVAGVGIAYAIDHSIGSQVDYKYSVIGFSQVEGDHVNLVAMAIGPNGDPASGVKVSAYANGGEVASGVTNSSGEVSLGFTSKAMPYTLIVYQEDKQNVTDTLAGNDTFSFPSPYTNELLFSPAMSNTYSGPSIMISNYFPNGSVKLYVSTLYPISLCYNVTSHISPSTHVGSGPLENSHFIANQSEGIKSYIIKVRDHPSALYFDILAKPIHSYNPGVYSYEETTQEVTSRSAISIDELEGFESSFSLYAEFFPIIFLYLAYSLLAKPKGTGALEFLLSKPITREQIFVNRFMGGVITAFVSSGVFMVIVSLTLLALTGAFVGLIPTLYIFIGLSLSLVAFYSLMFLIGGIVNSSGTFLGLSILTFVFFLFIEPVLFVILEFNGINIVKYEDYLSFDSPLAFMEHYAEGSLSSLFTSAYYNVSLEVVDVILWIFLPVMIGYVVFTQLIQKRRLTSNRQ